MLEHEERPAPFVPIADAINRVQVLRLLGVAALWLALGRFLPDVLWRALPRALLDVLSLPSYGMLCQTATTLLALGAAWLVLEEPRGALRLRRPCGWHLLVAVLIGPAVFVVSSYVALKVAEPYLMAELAREGAGASRRNAGAFGKAITEAPLVVTLLWGAILAAFAEELELRGALFAATEGVVRLLSGSHQGSDAASRRSRWIRGATAIVVTAAIFGAMHADMKGSVGIVRVVSASCLGLACGTARSLSRTVFVSMAIHFTHNAISLGLGRGIFNGDSEPLLSVVPNRLLAIAIGGAAGAIAVGIARRRVARSAQA